MQARIPAREKLLVPYQYHVTRQAIATNLSYLATDWKQNAMYAEKTSRQADRQFLIL